MDRSEPFLYTGQMEDTPRHDTDVIVVNIYQDIPRDVTHVRVDPSVTEIYPCTFQKLRHLVHVELCEGLKSIHTQAFKGCRSLHSIRIPSTVIFIAEDAFKGCNSLENIEFCEEIELFVNEVSLPWWNRGVSEVSLSAVSFLAEFNIPLRLAQIKKRSWKIHIHDMLQRIPEGMDKDNRNESEYWEAWHEWEAQYWEELDEDEEGGGREEPMEQRNYLSSIESQLIKYEEAEIIAPILELALWKSHMEGKPSSHRKKLECRYNSLSMVPIIIPNVLSFL